MVIQKYLNHLCRVSLLFVVVLITACQTVDPLPNQDYHTLRENSSRMNGELVRLGGRVVAVSSTDQNIKLEVMSVPLIFGQPDLRANTQGRFVASINRNALNEAENQDITALNGKIITVIGNIDGQTELYNITDYFPTFIVEVSHYQFFDLKELALIQGLVEGKEHDLNALNLRLMSRVAELQFLKSFIPNRSTTTDPVEPNDASNTNNAPAIAEEVKTE